MKKGPKNLLHKSHIHASLCGLGRYALLFMGEYKYQPDSKPPTEKWLYKSEVKKKINKFEWYEKETFDEKKRNGFLFYDSGLVWAEKLLPNDNTFCQRVKGIYCCQ